MKNQKKRVKGPCRLGIALFRGDESLRGGCDGLKISELPDYVSVMSRVLPDGR